MRNGNLPYNILGDVEWQLADTGPAKLLDNPTPTTIVFNWRVTCGQRDGSQPVLILEK